VSRIVPVTILDTNRLISVTAKQIGRILKEIAIIIGQLLKGLIILAARNARSHGKPAIIHLGRWLKEKTIVFIRWAKPKAIEAGQTSKGLIIVAVRKVKTSGGEAGEPKDREVVQINEKKPHRILGKITEMIKEQARKVVREENYETLKQQKITTIPAAAKISDDIVLENEKIINLNEILAKEVSQNGIECRVITDIGSLPIEKKSYYSHLFPMSPRIVTNRGCIRLEGNGTRRNIDFIQIIQKN
jgi:ribosomal 30S subunit maturation factor RimM